eukprot:CAMPEP_0115538434 /NCGR_PEP_ID=MMETSP0271-20121206/88880_1 /TAXON_ID=71861 /ORGANISM="Scrippsiella trochoidea, Strain CCMP3099" /LENGTH=66 /DNA_ID=CAMNT_0002971337 /DNA_START=173 /DNA_END=369 /DNA_ORIENTATION=-
MSMKAESMPMAGIAVRTLMSVPRRRHAYQRLLCQHLPDGAGNSMSYMKGARHGSSHRAQKSRGVLL